jgi:uncharacterized protein YggU (UPF0235/DUF167 family)
MLIHVKVITESKKESVLQKSPVAFVVSVRTSPIRNQANVRMLLLLANFLGIKVSCLKIITGHHTPSKILEVIQM